MIDSPVGPFPAHVTGQTEIISFDAVPKQLDSHFRVREGINRLVFLLIPLGFERKFQVLT